MKQPEIKVGILSKPNICFTFHGDYSREGEVISGNQEVIYQNSYIQWKGKHYKELLFIPFQKEESFFELANVVIGIDFHWQRKENQLFQGSLKLIVQEEKMIAINIVSIEDYLKSVISSEMSATASLELLKAHAVISRSWLLAQINKKKEIENTNYTSFIDTEEELIQWFDREDHLNFDVCADDHCQRYQGITRASTERVDLAVNETKGEVLVYNKAICDARFSKCCGGAFEEFPTCWENKDYPYLKGERDSKDANLFFPDLRKSEEAENWIRTSPPAFCNTKDRNILSQVLNNYDQETDDFYRWSISYTVEELSKLVFKRTGIEFGMIQEIIPIDRGSSGRLIRVKIVGTKSTRIIGKELIIRRAFSNSHLYSSAFIVDKKEGNFIFTGAGWGHGVGLCQIGAAVMGEQGYKYDEILFHYYKGTTIEKLY